MLQARRTALLAAAAALLLGACSHAPSTPPGALVAPTTSSAPRTASATAAARPGVQDVQIAEVAHVGRFYSVILHNPNHDVGLLRQRFTLLAQHADGRSAAFGDERPPETPDTCCIIEWLPPGGDYGLFFDDGDAPRDLGHFVLALRGGGFRPWATQHRAAVTTTATGPVRMTDGNGPLGATLVPVHVSSVATRPVDAVVQPVLTDAAGHLVAVIGARVECVRPGAGLSVVLDYPSRVPPGTRVGRVLTWPTTDLNTASSRC